MKKCIFAELFLIVFLVFLVGCQEPQRSDSFKDGLLLSVDFKPDVPLKYKFVCQRQITLDLDSSGKSSGKGSRSKSDKRTEKLEMEIVYRPLQIDPYGYSTIEATCNSAKVTRTAVSNMQHQRKDAVEFLAGKSFTLKVTPTGRIDDYTSLGNLVKELGEEAFDKSSNRGRIKDPDMIMDFVATQWNMWDSISSIKEPLKGLKKGRKWNSKLLAPLPFVSRTGRDVEYQFTGIVEANDISLAEITSSYKLSPKSLLDTPFPYGGSFQMRGMFGFLQGYKVLSIDGSGRQLYDIERGLIKSDTQQYHAEASASIFGLGRSEITPNIIVDQTITTTLVE